MMMLLLSSLRFPPSISIYKQTLLNLSPLISANNRTTNWSLSSTKSFHQQTLLSSDTQPPTAVLGYINGSKKAIQLAHSVWEQLLRKGDTAIDATCGNGHDTLALLKMLSHTGTVYGLDIQKTAIQNTTSLLSNAGEHANVKLFQLCHTRMEDIVAQGSFVRVVAFNLGYLPGGDKSVITVPEKTVEALQAASRVLGSGGVISVMVYVGHAGGRKEYDTVLGFASALPVETWVCSKFEMVNRPSAPLLVFMFKK